MDTNEGRQTDKKVPQMRFKLTQSDWAELPIAEILTEIKRTILMRDDQRYQLINVKRRNEGIVSRGYLFGREILVKNYSQLQAGDFVISKRQVVHGATGIVPSELNDAIVSNEYLVAVSNEKITTEFLTTLASLPAMRKKFFLSSYGVDIEKLFFDTQDWKKRTVRVPALPEQRKISSFVSELERMIRLHLQKHDKLASLKKAMLQKMFPQFGATTPEIRFKGFTAEWEPDYLGNRVTFFSGLTYSPSDVVSSGGTLVLRSSNVKNGEVIDADNVYVNSAAVNCERVRESDVIVVVRNGSRSLIGKHAQISKVMSNTVIGAFMTGIRHENASFINALLDSPKFTSEVERNLGATINQITTGSFKVMRFLFPCPAEQRKLGTYFRILDELISKHSIQLQKLQQIKSACLERMFA